MPILITGGAGYIGSHTAIELLQAGFDVVVVDSLINSSYEAINRIETITQKKVKFFKHDICDANALNQIFTQHNIESVIHFAGLKAVGESVEKPLLYYEHNLHSTISLLNVMQKNEVFHLIFSSSATVYGDPQTLPIKENFPLNPSNPYGRTKWMIEWILTDLAKSDQRWHIALLRYFNPVGAHPSGLIGEDPKGIPNNLMPYISQVAVKKRSHLNVFGHDYPTPDGTCIRDFIHVVDLALGHLAALKHIKQIEGCKAYNLGTGRGSSVLEVIRAFSEAAGFDIPFKLTGRRAGDVSASYAEVKLAAKELDWKAKKDLKAMCEDAWRWQQQNPNGLCLLSE